MWPSELFNPAHTEPSQKFIRPIHQALKPAVALQVKSLPIPALLCTVPTGASQDGCRSPPFNKLLYERTKRLPSGVFGCDRLSPACLRSGRLLCPASGGPGRGPTAGWMDGHGQRCQGACEQKHQSCVCFLPLLRRRLSDTDRP